MARGVAVLAVTVLLGGTDACAWTPDAWLTAKVKTTLLLDDGLTAARVNVDTSDGRVTLHGPVPSARRGARMVRVARAVDGVREVRDLLRVTPTGDAAPAPEPPRPERRAIVRALRTRGALRDVSVGEVDGGTVVLRGRVRLSTEHLEALRLVRRVPGVRRVASEITVAEPDGPLDIVETHELEDNGRGVTDAAWDVWLTTEVKLRLLRDERVSALAVNVDTIDREVTLFGTVPSETARAAAVATAGGVSGVRRVRDYLQIVPATRAAASDVRDDDLHARVTAGLAAREVLAQAVIRVEVENRVVRLTGSVPTQHHRLVAATAAGEVDGVRAVVPDLEVRRMTREKSVP